VFVQATKSTRNGKTYPNFLKKSKKANKSEFV